MAEHRQGGVAAHGAGRLGAVLCHGDHDVAHIFVAVAKSLLQTDQIFLAVRGNLLIGHLQILHPDQVPVQPLSVGLAGGVGGFQLVVIHQLALDRVHQQHFARAQPVFAQNVLRGNVQHAHFAGQNQPAVLGQEVPAGPQTVPVQHRAHHIAVAEQNGGRAVPGFQHGGVILVKVPFLGVHTLVVAPGFRNGDHHRQRQVHAVHHHEFQGVVQHGGVGAVLIHNGQYLGQVVLQVAASHGLLTGQHGVHVAPDGVDFAVVENEPVGVGPVPAGGGVGGEPAVNHADGSFVVRVLKVRVELTQLLHQEHTFIYNRSAGQAAHIGFLAGLFEYPPGHIQPPVKINSGGNAGGFLHKGLPDAGHTAAGLVTQNFRADGNFTPAQEGETFLFADDFKQFFRLVPL